jgi:hypothetical protein
VSDARDQLLYVITARKEISWSTFKAIFDSLAARSNAGTERDRGDPRRYARRRLVRALDALGHCEVAFTETQGSISVTQPTLCRLPISGLPQGVLTGARSPSTVPYLVDICRQSDATVSIDVSSRGSALTFIPRRVIVETESLEQLGHVAASVGVAFESQPPAWKILNFSASLEQYLETLKWTTESEPNWLRKDFDADRLSFRDDRVDSSLRLSRYSDPVRSLPLTFLWKDTSRAEVQPDWARYAILNEARKSVLVYDRREFRLVVPATVPFPRLIERGLVLSSGFAPQLSQVRVEPEVSAMPCYIYEAVPPQIASLAAWKLGQCLAEASIDLIGGEVE